MSKIYAEIIDIRDVEKLQRALDLLVKWAELWQLKIATKKCFTLNIGKIPSCRPYIKTCYLISN